MFRNRVRNGVLLGVAVLLALAAASWFLVLSPRLNEASAVTEEALQVDFANTQLQARYRQIVDQAAAAPQAAQEAQRLFASMPQQADLPEVLLQIIDAAGKAGIPAEDITVINTTVPQPVAGTADASSADGSTPAPGDSAAKSLGVSLATLGIDLTVTGPRDRLLEFLRNVEGLDRAALVTTTALADAADATTGLKSGTQTLDVTATMFVLQSKLPDLVAQVQKLIAQSGA